MKNLGEQNIVFKLHKMIEKSKKIEHISFIYIFFHHFLVFSFFIGLFQQIFLLLTWLSMALVDPSMFIFCFCFLFFSMFFKKDSSSLYYFHLFLFSSEQCFCVYFVLLPCFFSSFLKWLFATILFIQKTGVFDDIFNV